jgi:signal peptidase II
LNVLYLSAFIILTDQLTKIFVKGFSIPALNFYHEGLRQGFSIPVLENFFYITLVENPGIAFGIDLPPAVKLIFTLFTILASLALIVYLFTIKNQNYIYRAAVAVIIGGAFGNLVDRVFYGWLYGYGEILSGSVVDFLDIRFLNLFFNRNSFSIYVFNVADLAITFGAVTLILLITRKKKEPAVEESLSAQEEN